MLTKVKEGDPWARRTLARYGGLLMMAVGAFASFVVPFVGVPLLLTGFVVAVIGFTMPAHAESGETEG